MSAQPKPAEREAARLIEVPDGMRALDASEWKYQRWGWMESVRRDETLSATARLLAHSLALDFANAKTARCDPRVADLLEVLGVSKPTIKRALRDLKEGGWIASCPGIGRGNHSGYLFLTRARIVHLKEVKNDPVKGVTGEPFYDPLKGVKNDPEKGSKMSHPYNIDKPYKNHRGEKAPKSFTFKASENPMVQQEAERAVTAWRDGRDGAFDGLRDWVIGHIIATNLLTPHEVDASGIAEKIGGNP